jgi:hypothetical protein
MTRSAPILPGAFLALATAFARGSAIVAGLRPRAALFAAAILFATPALAGPPYVTDDPEPVAPGHFEIYLYAGGSAARGGSDGQSGIDFNYGAAPDLQLTAVLPLSWISSG